MEQSSFGPIRTRRIYEEICDAIRQKVVSGELKLGDRLPSERELSEVFSVSRTAVREALRSLEIAGMIDLKLGSKGGAFIARNAVLQVTRSFNDMVEFGDVSAAELLEARKHVIEMVTRLAAQRATSDDIAALRRNLDEIVALSASGQYDARLLKAVEFYTLIASATRNNVLAAMVEGMGTVIKSFLLKIDPAPPEKVIKQRKRFIDQLEAGDVEGAVQTMRDYLDSITTHLLDAQALRQDRLRTQKRRRSAKKAAIAA